VNIKIVSGLGSTPARVNRLTGTIFLNKDIWQKLNPEAKKFIVLHEIGHYKKNTISEFEADNYAAEQFIGSEPCSLKKINRIMWEQLDTLNNPEHKQRYKNIIVKLLIADTILFKNLKSYQILKKMEKDLLTQNLIEYLKEKQITNLNQLTNEQKEVMLVDLMLSPETLTLIEADMIAENEKNSDFLGIGSGKWKNIFEKLKNNDNVKNAFQSISGNYIAKFGKGLGLAPNSDLNAINETVLNQVTGNSPPTVQGGKSNDNGGNPPAADNPNINKTETKKNKWLIPVIVGGIVVLGIILFFVLKPKKK